jgi:hypothetical protein
LKIGELYYNKQTDELIGTQTDAIKTLSVTIAKLHKLRYEREGGGWLIDLDELTQPIVINSIIDEDGDEIATSVGEMCKLEDLNTEVVLKRLRRVEGQPNTRRFIEEPIMGAKNRPISWKYKIEDEWGDYMTDDMEKLAEMTGLPLDRVYFHVKEKTAGDDSVWIFYPYEVD